MTTIDKINHAILQELQEDGRTTVADLARAVGRAESTVRERLEGLERDGIIRGYRAEVDPAHMGHEVHALVSARCDRSKMTELERQLEKVPEVVRALICTGRDAIQLEIVAEDMEALDDLIEQRIAPMGLEALDIQPVVRELVPRRGLPRPRSDRGAGLPGIGSVAGKDGDGDGPLARAGRPMRPSQGA